LRITRGDDARVKEEARWDLANVSLTWTGVSLSSVPGRKNGTSTIFKKDLDVGRDA